MKKITIKTSVREELIDITELVVQEIRKEIWTDGFLTIYTPHTTAAITINENADPSVQHDIAEYLKKLIPKSNHFTHIEGNSDSHIKSSIIGCSTLLIIEKQRPVLGTWQGIFFFEFDGPRNRKIYLKFIESK